MHAYLREVARGEKGARDLAYDTALAAAEAILDEAATDAQVGAFLIAERMKGESDAELLAFVHALRRRSASIGTGVPRLLDCAGPYDGRSHSFAATIPAAFILAAHEVPVVLHGSAPLPPKYGIVLGDILAALGVPRAQTAADVEGDLREHRFAFIDTERFCPPLAALRRLREELGVRTLLNTAEKFLNLASAEFAVVGVFHGTALEKVANLASQLGYRKAMVVQGVDGSEDVPTHRDSAACLVQDGRVDPLRIQPAALGLKAECPRVELTAAEQAAAITDVLRGQSHPFRNMVLLNTALRLWLVERAESLEHGVELAREALDSGRAWAVYQGLCLHK